jgi:hypothetical protein
LSSTMALSGCPLGTSLVPPATVTTLHQTTRLGRRHHTLTE